MKKTHIRDYLLLSLLTLFLLGCVPTATSPTELLITPEVSVFMPQLQTRSTTFMEALLIGELVVQDGCLRVQSGEESQLVIWQADYFLNNKDGTLEILDETGKMVAYVGETVYMGGGEVGLTAELEAGLREPIPDGCAKPQKIWLMGEFLPEEYKKNLQE